MPSSQARPERRVLLAWLAFAIWAAVVLGLGSDAFSHGSTSRYLLPLLRWLLPDVEPATRLEILHGIRKAAHVVEYAVLGALSYRALRLSSGLGRAGLLLVSSALLLAFAGADEARQALSPLRSGRLQDVALDLAGGLAGIALVACLGGRARAGEPARRAEPG